MGEAAVPPVAPRATLEDLRQEIRRRWGVPSATLAVSLGAVAGSGWEASRGGGPGVDVLPTGCILVDELLPGGGIPRGRLTEITGSRSSGRSSLVSALVACTLRDPRESESGRAAPGPATRSPAPASSPGRRVAWVDPERAFHAPSAARAGIPLERLVLVHPPSGTGAAGGPWEMFRAAEHLLRSRALALVVLDATEMPGRGAAAPLYRLSRLAWQCRTAVVLMTEHPERASSLGSCVALRLCLERRSYCFDPSPRPPFDLSGYRIEVQVGRVRWGVAGLPKMVEVSSGDGAVP